MSESARSTLTGLPGSGANVVMVGAITFVCTATLLVGGAVASTLVNRHQTPLAVGASVLYLGAAVVAPVRSILLSRRRGRPLAATVGRASLVLLLVQAPFLPIFAAALAM
jgi:hypothetical protein